MKNLFAFLLLFFSNHAYAQVYVPLSPLSDFTCVQLPDGSIKTAKNTSTGYEIVSPDSIQKALHKNLRALDNRVKALNEMKEGVKDGDPASKKGFFAQIAATQKLLEEALSPYNYSKKRKEQLAVLNELIAQIKDVQKQMKQEVKSLNDCVKKKKLPLGFIGTTFQLKPGGVFAVLVGDADDFNTSNNYCVRGPGIIGIQGYRFQPDVCSGYESSCSSPLPKGKIGIYLSSIQWSGTFSEDQIRAWVGQLTEKFGGAYEVRLQLADKNYNLRSCNDIFGLDG